MSIAPFGEIDARVLGDLAALGEESGWDGVFVWDHMLWDPGGGVTDTTVALTVVALATTRVRFGPLVTPLPRRRPWKLAREIASLDRLSGGRFVLGVGTGDDLDFEPVGDVMPARHRGDVLDEALDLLGRLLEDEDPVDHDGDAYRVHGVRLRPQPVQPHVPVWVAAWWPHRRPLRRAGHFDGVVPLWPDLHVPTSSELDACLEVVRMAREEAGRGEIPLDVAVWGRTDDPRDTRAMNGLAGHGMTWWIEAFSPWADDLPTARARIAAGPPRADDV